MSIKLMLSRLLFDSQVFDDFLNINNPYYEGMGNQIYPSKLQLNKANPIDTEALFWDSQFSIANGFVSSKIYEQGDFDFDIYFFSVFGSYAPYGV